MSFAKYLELRFQTFHRSEKNSYDVTNDVEMLPFTSYQYFLYKYEY